MSRHARRAMMAAEAPRDDSKIGWEELANAADPDVVRSLISREIQGWGGGFLLLGVVQLIPGTALDHVWGVVLLLAAAASLYFNNAAMLPAFGVLLAWAMVSNALSGQGLWMVFALVQAYFVFQTFQQFVILRRATSRLEIGLEAESLHHADVVFPWAGCSLTAAAWVGIAVLFVVGLVYGLNEQSPSEEALGVAGLALVDIAVLGIALAVSSLAARYRFRVVSILALLGAGLFLASFAALAILGSNG